jgi:sortase A
MNRWSPIESLEVAFWAIGILLVVLFFAARVGGEWERDQALASFGEARAAAQSERAMLAGLVSDPLAGEGIEPLSPSGAPDPAPVASESAASSPASAAVDSSMLPVALLRIPSIDLEVPVFADTSERNLNRGAGWVEGTAAPDDNGNMAIAGHRDRHFRPLKDVAVGDVLELESLTGQRSYRITKIFIVEPENVTPLDASDDAVVTLVTCYPFYFIGNAPQRYIVRAVAVE